MDLLITIPIYNNPLIGKIILYFGYPLFGIILISFTMYWMRQKYLGYQQSQKPFLQYVAEMSHENHTVCILLTGICIDLFLFSLLFYAVKNTSMADAVVGAGDIQFTLIVRTALCLFTYLLPSRLFRSKLDKASAEVVFKTELIKFVSHELRSPLNVVSIDIELIHSILVKLGVNNTEICDNLTDVRESCDSCVEILDNLMLYEQIESNTISIEQEIHSPLKFSQKMITLFHPTAEKVGLNINLINCLDSNDSFLHIDASKIKLVFNAVLHPALISTRQEGGVTIILERIQEAPEKHGIEQPNSGNHHAHHDSWIRIRIGDTRSRASYSDSKAILHNKFRWDREFHADEVNPGFRLWIAKKIMHLHGGSIKYSIIMAYF